MSLLYDFAWSRTFEITQKDHRELKIILTNKLDYPYLTKIKGKNIIVLTKPRKKNNGVYSLFSLVFPPSEKGAVVDMFSASIYHLAIHVVSSDFSIYRDLFHNEEKSRIRFVLSIIEDTIADAYLKMYWPGFRKVIAFANAVSYVQLKEFNENEVLDSAIYRAILAMKLTGFIKGEAPKRYFKTAEDIFALLLELEKSVIKKGLELKKRDSLSSRLNTSEIGSERLETAKKILKLLDKVKSPTDIPSLPYGENWGGKNVFNRFFKSDSDFQEALEATYKRLDIKTDNNFYSRYLEKINGESIHILESQEIYDYRLQHIVKQYKKLGKDLNFRDYNIPVEDYSEFLKIRSSLSGPIRRILEDLKRVKERTEESYMEESGNLDLQAAIQVLASKTMRNDIFVREELLDKSESWAILVDASLSLAMCRGDVRSISVALAEVARNLIGGEDSWGLFAFNDTFQIIKDFYEPYNNNIRAKIGGLQHRGLSLLPDAVDLATKSLAKTGEDVKILLLITDGVPTGYTDIEEKFINSVKNAQKSNVTPIIIGLGSKNIKKMFRNSCQVENVTGLMKQFVGLYHETHYCL
jgi:hypothetical protein